MIQDYGSTILLVTGAVTALAGLGTFVPSVFVDVLVGLKTTDATTLAIARHWSVLLGLVGGLLIYGAYHPEVQVPVMLVGAAEKLALGVIAIASPLRKRRLTMAAVGADVIMAILYIILLASRGTS